MKHNKARIVRTLELVVDIDRTPCIRAGEAYDETQNSASKPSGGTIPTHLGLPPLPDLATGIDHAFRKPGRQQPLEALSQRWFPHDPLERYQTVQDVNTPPPIHPGWQWLTPAQDPSQLSLIHPSNPLPKLVARQRGRSVLLRFFPRFQHLHVEPRTIMRSDRPSERPRELGQ